MDKSIKSCYTLSSDCIFLSVSLVLYKPSYGDLKRLFMCFDLIKTPLRLIIVDNSPTDVAESIVKKFGFDYIHNPKNTGFGGGHNIAMRIAIEEKYRYHLIINPDVYFDSDIITLMLREMILDDSIGLLMPEILNEDLSVQYLPKLLPSPIDLLIRKIKWPNSIFNIYLRRFELRFVEREKIYNSPIISGCFMMVNINAIKKVGLFDEKYFMYFEDWDLSRRIHRHYKTLYFPLVSVVHGYESGANKNIKLFFSYLNSACRYFGKWGWFYDRDRVKTNAKALSQF